MISNAISIYYENDSKLKNFFKLCAERAETLLNQRQGLSQIKVENDRCNAVYINDVLFKSHTSPTLILVFSHGDDHIFTRDDHCFYNVNNHGVPSCLQQGFLYTNACNAGNGIGVAIGEKGGCFFGYSSQTKVLFHGLERIFADCDLYGLKFLLEGKSLSEAKSCTIRAIENKIDELHGKGCTFSNIAASFLREARDNIVVHGEHDFKL